MHYWKTKLKTELTGYGKLAIAFSGGCDSTLLAEAAGRFLGKENVLLLLADSVLLPRAEFHRARELAQQLELRLEIISLSPLDDPQVRANDPLRCYYCKKRIFTALREHADRLGFPDLADGANADDAGDYRPGAQAADEQGIRHPLKELPKAAIRELSREWNLSTWELPAAACLASRIPTGTPLAEQALKEVEEVETILESLGFSGCRARRLSNTELRLEFPPEQLERARRLSNTELRLAFESITIAPYRTGSMNRHS